MIWRRILTTRSVFPCWKTGSIDFVHSEEEKEHLIFRGQNTFACSYIYFNGQQSTATSSRSPSIALYVHGSPSQYGQLFRCGKPGHWRSACPAMVEQQPPPALIKWLQDQDKSGAVNSIFDYNDFVMEAEDDSVLDCNLVSFCSEIHPLVLASLGTLMSGILYELRNLFSMPSVNVTRFFSFNFLHLFSRPAMFRRFLTVCSCLVEEIS